MALFSAASAPIVAQPAGFTPARGNYALKETFVLAGATLTLTAALHAGKTIQLAALAGSVVTLPAATGTGNHYNFTSKVLATSNVHKIQVANATDVMSGAIIAVDGDDGAATAFGCVAASDTISLGTTSGNFAIGEYIKCVDVKAGYWSVSGFAVATGDEATCFSAGV